MPETVMQESSLGKRITEERTKIIRNIHTFLTGFVQNTLGPKTSYGNYGVTKQGNLETLTFTAYRTAYSEAKKGFKRKKKCWRSG